MIYQVENGQFAYKGQPPLLSDIDLSVDSGEMLVTLGANGAGKTTLLRCLLRLLHWSGGRSLLEGRDVAQWAFKAFWRHVGYVPQARSLSFVYTVKEMVLMGRAAYQSDFSRPSAEDRAAARDAMERMGVAHLADRLCSRISGGEYQLVLVARALCGCPKLLVLDEPESSLDLKNQLVVLRALEQTCHHNQLAVIFNTHYPDHALALADKALLLMPDGKNLFGDSTAVLTETNIETAFDLQLRLRTIEIEGWRHRTIIPLPPLGQSRASAAETDVD